MSQPTRSNSPFTGPTPATIPPPAAEPLLPQVLAVMADLQHLYDQVAIPGALIHEAVLSANGTSVTLPVSGITALSSWNDAHPHSAASVGSRTVGGLVWQIKVGLIANGVQVWVTAVTGEFEELPDTRLVRSLCPDLLRRQAVRAREIAAHAVSAVAA